MGGLWQTTPDNVTFRHVYLVVPTLKKTKKKMASNKPYKIIDHPTLPIVPDFRPEDEQRICFLVKGDSFLLSRDWTFTVTRYYAESLLAAMDMFDVKEERTTYGVTTPNARVYVTRTHILKGMTLEESNNHRAPFTFTLKAGCVLVLNRNIKGREGNAEFRIVYHPKSQGFKSRSLHPTFSIPLHQVENKVFFLHANEPDVDLEEAVSNRKSRKKKVEEPTV